MKLNKKLKSCALSVRPSLISGYGVFAEKPIRKNDVIEECYSLMFSKNDTPVSNYVFYGGEDLAALPLGYGAIYNHCDKPNADFIFDVEAQILRFIAVRDIAPNEEITIYYNKNWFAERNMTVRFPWRYRYRECVSLFKMILRFGMVVSVIYLIIWLPQLRHL